MDNELTIARPSGFGRGKVQRFAQNVVTLGTDPGCDVRFDATWDKTVSPRHATLRRDGPRGWRLEDTSRDGCWIDGRRLPARQTIDPGDTTVELGRGGPRVVLTYVAAEPAAEPVRPAPAAVVVPSAAVRPPDAAASFPAASSAQIVPVPPPSVPTRPNRGLLLAALGAVFALAAAAAGWFVSSTRAPQPVARTDARPATPSASPTVPLASVAPAMPAPTPVGNADERLAAVARQYEDAVGLVLLVAPSRGGEGAEGLSFPSATAWALGDHVFATNSHVTEEVNTLMAKGITAFIVINRHPELHFRVTRAVSHPRYGKLLVNIEGRRPAVPAYDVGLLYVNETAPHRLTVAPEAELRQLASGYRVGYLGFPMEGLSGGGVDYHNPVATMQSGILTSVTDYFLSGAEYPDALLLQHNLGAVGGASGSPIFNARGEVVGLLSAGNVIGQVDSRGKVVRAPSAALINFAQRVDLLRDIYPEYPK